MRKIVWLPLALLAPLTAYLCLWPVPIDPVVWQTAPAPGYTGAHAVNEKLLDLHMIDLHGETGPETVLAAPDGKLYTGLTGGHILRMQADGSAQQIVANTGGRPLGLALDGAGQLIVADATKGLLSIAPDGKVSVLADTVQGTPIRFADALIIARDGKIYFTDASMRFSPAQWGSTLEAATLDVLEQSATGRVLEYDPATKAVRVLARGLSFANGIALSEDEHTLFVNETARYRVWQLAVTANNVDMARPSPDAKVLLDNLPGYPDNLMRGRDGKIWLGLAGQRNDLDAMAAHPALRRLAMRLPRLFWKMPKPYGHVVAFKEDGRIVEDLQDPSGHSLLTTGATETAQRLYIHNIDGKGLGWLAR